NDISRRRLLGSHCNRRHQHADIHHQSSRLIRQEDPMFKRMALITAVLALTIALGITIAASSNDLKSTNVTVHEWGTFTTVAGPKGDAIDWLPLSGHVDLPCFVLHFDRTNNEGILKSLSPAAVPLSYTDARSSLIGR